MNKELGPLPEHQNETDKYGTELATRLAEHARDLNQDRITYEVIVQGRQWHIDVTMELP